MQERAVTMGENFTGDFEQGYARGTRESRPDNKKIEEEAYRAGKNMGYHLGYNLGFESGYEKGYSEGSTLGYNNGFLAALGLGEGSFSPHNKLEDCVCQTLQKLIALGQARVILTGCAAREAGELLKLVKIDAVVAGSGKKL
ncbi:hypothetical protein ACOBQJ_11815 [Pelotomaculum propionicicum]|uniref:hypothetical protein n=1 Tax=Pelotomaculum propionicicum TaxID=258475 RepID=UPI003B7ADFEE